ncbi:protocadherin-11 X-linked isoform X1 [Octopus bimaculoides]|uniref:protocadherin-11 X-linked isoform X1 n=1 Tax=Octopus bimaculoides TaxID=37653 RepID=UPI0022E8C0E1|nr:protocadherin-11 X-linked isoform X1 [Octopus bimaculoides]
MQALTSLLLLVLCLPGIYSEGGLSYKIREELPAGTFIGNILTDAKILDSVAPEERNLIRLRLLSQAGRGSPALFNVSEVSGELHTAQRLDAESLCDVAIICKRTVDVAVQKDKELLKVLKVEVIIEDSNDHVPLFAEKEIEVQFLDGDTNKRKSIAKATDGDVGVNNSHITYRLEKEESSDPFRLDVTTRPDGSSDLYLYLDGKLDRETKPGYTVRILAEDNGKPPKKSSLDVKIIVADVNDNAPVFEKAKYNVTTENEVNKSKAIVYVKANDADSGKNGQVSYKFSSRTSSVAKKLFELDEDTGAIYLSQKISVEQPTKYKLFVEAVDGAERPLSAQVVVHVQIIHSQNNPPKISINFVSHTAKITEGANSESFVAYVQVKDPDIGENGKVGCALTHEYFRLRSLDKDDYEVVIKKPVDRETNEHFNVTITCRDQGSPPLQSESNFRVEVDDINDEYPQFERPVYDVTFEENSIIGIKVEAVSARDKDIGQNGEVRYFFDRDALPYFIVDPQTGIIRTVTVFDRESTSKKEFKIYAKDLGKPSHTSSATMRVNVLDVNDEAPVFTEKLFHFKTYENQLPKFPVGFINATDRDLGDGGKLSYSLITDENQVLPFWISDDGFLSVGQLLDHEYQNSYRFKVFVKDNGKPSLNNTVDVLVDVLDENDNRPYFLFPSVTNFSMAIYYYPDGEKEITVLQATDRDSGENARLSYEIVSGNENGLFAVDALYGSLSFAREANRDDNGMYMLQLMVKDRGKPPLSTTANFSLSLVVSNETSNKHGEFLTPSNGGVGQNLLVVIALIAVTGSVGLVILITICVIRWNDRRQTSSRLTSSSSSASSGGHQNSSKCLPTPQISTALELGPSLQNDNTLKGNSTFRTSQRNQDRNIFNPCHGKQSEIFQPTAATVNQGQVTNIPLDLYPLRNISFTDHDQMMHNNQINNNSVRTFRT